MSQNFEPMIDRKKRPVRTKEHVQITIRRDRRRRFKAASMTNTVAALLIAAALTSCASAPDSKQVVYRDLKIFHGQFNRAGIEVPVATPIMLEIGVEGPTVASVYSPSLGIEPTAVPSNAIAPRKGGSEFRVVRVPVQPLAAGKYLLICQCGGHEDTILIEAH